MRIRSIGTDGRYGAASAAHAGVDPELSHNEQLGGAITECRVRIRALEASLQLLAPELRQTCREIATSETVSSQLDRSPRHTSVRDIDETLASMGHAVRALFEDLKHRSSVIGTVGPPQGVLDGGSTSTVGCHLVVSSLDG